MTQVFSSQVDIVWVRSGAAHPHLQPFSHPNAKGSTCKLHVGLPKRVNGGHMREQF